MSSDNDTATEIHDFWFADAFESAEAHMARSGVWFGGGETFDSEIRKRFEELPQYALGGKLDNWLSAPKSAVSLVLVLDQFPRNLFRGNSASFRFDQAACAASTLVISRGFDEMLDPIEAVFLYLPYEHAEDMRHQEHSVELFRALEDRVPDRELERFEGYTHYAERHRDIIARFGRFPHRNEVLGRESTREEIDFLSSGDGGF